MVSVLSAAAQLANAENADLGEVLNGLTTSMNDFGFGSDKAADVASKAVLFVPWIAWADLPFELCESDGRPKPIAPNVGSLNIFEPQPSKIIHVPKFAQYRAKPSKRQSSV